MLFPSRTCPNCALAKEQLNSIGLVYEVIDAEEHPELAMQYSEDNVSYIVSCYGEYFKALRSVENQLQSTGLSERHQAAMDEYSAQIESCSVTIAQGAAGYNEKGRSFLKSYDKFPTSFWADVTGAWFPGYFYA